MATAADKTFSQQGLHSWNCMFITLPAFDAVGRAGIQMLLDAESRAAQIIEDAKKGLVLETVDGLFKIVHRKD